MRSVFTRSARVSAAHGNNGGGTALMLNDLGLPSAEPSFIRGRAEFNSVFADLARGKRNWQLIAFGAVGVAGVLATGLVMVAAQSRVTPYVVEVDKLGRAQAFGPAEPLRVTDQRVAVAQIAGFVRDIRMVLADPTAQADLVRHAYAYVDQAAADFLNTYFASPANDPRTLGREFTRVVEVTGVLPVPGATGGQQTWKVNWTETSIPRAGGSEPMVSAWEGYFTTRIVPPATTERITLNPLGLYITSVNWTQLASRPARLEPAPPPVPTGVTP